MVGGLAGQQLLALLFGQAVGGHIAFGVFAEVLQPALFTVKDQHPFEVLKHHGPHLLIGDLMAV